MYARTQKPDNKTRRDFEAITLSLTRQPAAGGKRSGHRKYIKKKTSNSRYSERGDDRPPTTTTTTIADILYRYILLI